jgi:hypothetical protein
MMQNDGRHAVKLKPNGHLIGKIDLFAEDLMLSVHSASVEDRREVLGAVTKWIGVRHKLQESEGEDGAGLAGYRATITSPAGERAAIRSRAGATSRAILEAGDGEPVSELEALRQRLPTADAGHLGRSVQDLISEIHSASGGLRGVHVGIPGRKLPRRDEDDGGGDLQPDGAGAAGVADGDAQLDQGD